MAAEPKNGYIDIHAHILPGVDEGAANMEQALRLVRMAYENGIRTFLSAERNERTGRKWVVNETVLQPNAEEPTGAFHSFCCAQYGSAPASAARMLGEAFEKSIEYANQLFYYNALEIM